MLSYSPSPRTRNLTLAVEPLAESKVASDEVLAILSILIREVCRWWVGHHVYIPLTPHPHDAVSLCSGLKELHLP